MHIRPILPLALASACVLISASRAQAPVSPAPDAHPSPVPVIQANTRAVVVDVVVTRGHDEPVTALHKQDFQVFEDGKPQPIDFFEEHTAKLAPQNIPLVPMPPHVYTNVPSAPLSDSVNVLLLDSLNTPQQDQAYVHQQILEFIRTMKPATRVAIFTLGSRLRFIQGFTDDPALLQAAIDNKSYGFKSTTTNVSHTRSDDDADKAEVEAKIEAFGGGGRGAGTAGVAALQSAQADYAEFQTDQRVAITLGALQFLGRYLAAIPGRKNLIWFASSYPIYFFPKSTEKQPFNDHREYTDEIKRTADLMTLSKVAVYPIDAEGMMNDHPMDSDHDLAAAGGGAGLLRNTMEGAGQRSDTIAAMEQLAADTGGEAIFSTNDLNSALNHAINNGAHYYTLVYTPANKTTDGQFRHIDIKLTQPRCKLSYRRGYYADDMAHEDAPATGHRLISDPNPGAKPEHIAASDALQPLLMRGMPSATEILYGVRVVPAPTQPAPGVKRAGLNTRLTGPTTRYTADFLVDWKKVQLAVAPNGTHSGRLRVELIAYDRDGKVLNWAEQLMGLNFDAQTYAAIQRSGIPAHVEIDLPETEVYLATGVYDLQTSKAGSLEIPIDNRTAPKTQASVSSPASK